MRGEPAFINQRKKKKAIPQYTVGYGKILDRFNELEAAHSGLFFAGHYRNGISLGDSILAGLDVTHRINQQ